MTNVELDFEVEAGIEDGVNLMHRGQMIIYDVDTNLAQRLALELFKEEARRYRSRFSHFSLSETETGSTELTEKVLAKLKA